LAADESETELIRRLRKGDPAAFHGLVDGYARRLHGLAYSLLGNAQDAEDVVQETLSGAYRSIGSFQQRAKLWTWLVSILVRQVARSKRSLSSRSQSLKIDASPEELERNGSLQVGHPGGVTGTDAKIDVTAALAKLASDQREIIVLRELQQMSYDEISQVTELSIVNVKSKIHRARQAFKKRFAPYLDLLEGGVGQ